MVTYKNTDSETRTWPGLTDPATGSTLSLEPGGTVEYDSPLPHPDGEGEFEDTYLKIVAPSSSKGGKISPAAPPPPAEPVSTTPAGEEG